jgi:hypothetical protein
LPLDAEPNRSIGARGGTLAGTLGVGGVGNHGVLRRSAMIV